MSGRNTAVFGLYPDETELVEAIDQLLEAGFRATDLATLLPENLGSKDIGHEKSTKAPSRGDSLARCWAARSAG